MKTITIDIISVGNETKVPTARGGYSKLEVAYKDNGQVKGKNLVDFTNPDLYKFVKGLKQGDHVVVDIEKEAGSDGREYWQWKTAAIGRKEETGTPLPIQEASNSGPNATPTHRPSTGKVLGSNYETPEERARRQVLIVRQSSITAALKWFELNGGTADVQEVVEIAEEFSRYVFNGVDNAKESKETQRASTHTVVEKGGALVSQAVAVSDPAPVSSAPVAAKRRGRPSKHAETIDNTKASNTFTEDIPF